MGLCGDDRGHEHHSKGLYDNNEQKKFTNAKYNSPFLFLRLNSWTEWLTRQLSKSYKQGRHQLQVELCARCGTCKRCRMHERCSMNRWMRRGDMVHTLTCVQHTHNSKVHALSLKTTMPPTPCHRFSKNVKKLVIYQSNVLGMSTTDIAVNLDMPVCVVQWVLQTWDEIGAVAREPKTLGWARLMTTEQVQVSLTLFAKCLG